MREDVDSYVAAHRAQEDEPRLSALSCLPQPEPLATWAQTPPVPASKGAACSQHLQRSADAAPSSWGHSGRCSDPAQRCALCSGRGRTDPIEESRARLAFHQPQDRRGQYHPRAQEQPHAARLAQHAGQRAVADGAHGGDVPGRQGHAGKLEGDVEVEAHLQGGAGGLGVGGTHTHTLTHTITTHTAPPHAHASAPHPHPTNHLQPQRGDQQALRAREHPVGGAAGQLLFRDEGLVAGD